jgi:DNA repair exonuclease SbcCD ATPase subunit
MLTSINLKNFQLFEDQLINLTKINLITGLNRDSEPDEGGVYSGNAAGKSTILTAILFGLFGEVSDIKLNELVRDGSKEAIVTLNLIINNENYKKNSKFLAII